MIGFWEWFTMHNNWVSSVVLGIIFGLWAYTSGAGNPPKVKALAYTFVGLIGAGFLWVGVYIGGYGLYTRHWETCSKPEAVAAFYVFDAKKERCYKPVVGFAPVDNNSVITLTPKKMETGEWL